MADRTVSVNLDLRYQGFMAGLRAAKRGAEDFGKGLLSSAEKNRAALDDLARGTGILGAALTGFATLAIKRFADFDAAMSGVQSATHESAENMQLLRDAALEAGARTVFSATEAAGAIENLAKAGVSTQDILAGGLNGALDLAAAGELEVADAAEIAATAMTQFRLSGSDVPHVADLLAAAAGKAQGDVTDMSYALRQAGLVAAQAGLSIEETTGVLAAFASAGLLGSDAGTSLRTMLLRLMNPTGEVTELMADLGITAYDAQGNFVGLESLAGQLQERLGGMTQAQRDAALATIFGSDAIRAANVLYQQGEAGIRKWIAAVNDQGYAAETAAIRMDNLKGDIEELFGAIETALIGMGEGADGPLRSLVQRATEAVNAFNDLPAPVQQATLAIAGGGGLALLGVAALAKLITTIADARTSLQNLGITAGRVGRALRFAGAVGAIYAVGVAVDELSDRFSGAEVDVTKLTNSLEDWAGKGRAAGEAAKLLGGPLRDIVGDFNNLDFALDNLVKNDVFDYFNNFGEAIFPLSGPVDDARKRIEQLDQSLAQLVGSGHAREAARVFDVIIDRARRQNVTIEQLRELFPEYTRAVRDTRKANEEAAKAKEKSAEAAKKQEKAVSSAADVLEDMEERAKGLNDALELLNTTMGNVDAEIAYEQAVDDLEERFRDYREEIKKGEAGTKRMKNAFDLAEQAGRDNASAMLELWRRTSDYAVQIERTTGSQDRANRVLQQGREQLVRMAERFLGSRQAAERYVTEVLGIPKDVSTQVRAPGLADVLDRASRLEGVANRLNGKQVTTTFTEIHRRVTRSERWGAPGGFADGGLVRVGKMAPGGLVRGPGGPRDDRAGLFALSDGEFVVNASAAKRNMTLLRAINAGLVATGNAFDWSKWKMGAPILQTVSAGAAVASGGDTINIYARSIDLDERRLASVQRAAQLRQRIGRPR